jgi:uncharacterized membrane protein YeaQ/YmgE (transglycosylase-associated protein family)
MLKVLLSWCVFGLIVGAAARYILPGVQAMGLGMTILLGIAGSFLGGFLGSLILGGGARLQPVSLLLSIGGALLVLIVYSKLKT